MNSSRLRSDLRATSPQATEMEGVTEPPTPTPLKQWKGQRWLNVNMGERTPTALTLLVCLLWAQPNDMTKEVHQFSWSSYCTHTHERTLDKAG